MGTSAAESLTIEVLNGSGNKTAEQINFTTATASGTADHGKMVFAVDETTIATIDDGGIDLASGKEFSVNGTALSGGGKILQVVTGTSSTDTSVTSTSYTDSTLSASITPSATSSKILILVSQTVSVSRDSGNAIGTLNIMRATTQVWEGYVGVGSANGTLGQTSVMYLDSPSTTSATTYKTQGKVDTTANSGKIRFQQDSGLSDRNSSIHLIEIGA